METANMTPTVEATPAPPVTLLEPVALLSDYDHVETCRCPRCRTFTHPEYLQSKGNDVYGCSDCVKRVRPA
jgi:tRNA(Ile2) C34 agmatinyltransferase TiaS